MIRFIIVVTVAILVASAAHAANFESATMTVSASSILEPSLLKGEHYTIQDSVTVDGYMNHYKVDSDFGPFTVVGDRALRKLLREIDAIAELRKMTSLSAGTDAAVGAVVDTGKSIVNLATNPVETAKGMSAGVSRFFKRTTRTVVNVSSEVADSVSESITSDEQGDEEQKADDENIADNGSEEEDDPTLTSQLTSSVLGVGKAHRELARELKVDPYSKNVVLQEELSRVAKVSGTVGTVTNFLIPIPTVVGTAANISDMVWSLSPMDLLIQNEEKLKELGYADEQIQAFFSKEMFTPTMQTAIVGALAALDHAKGREVLLKIAIAAETLIEGTFIVRSILFAGFYDKNVEPIAEFLSLPGGMVPVVITASGDGLIIAPVDQLLWTEQIATAMVKMSALINDHGASDEQLMWVDGRISDLALTQLTATGWVESTETFDKLESATAD